MSTLSSASFSSLEVNKTENHQVLSTEDFPMLENILHQQHSINPYRNVHSFFYFILLNRNHCKSLGLDYVERPPYKSL